MAHVTRVVCLCALALVASCARAESDADATLVYEERVALLMLADSAALARLRSDNEADDFHAIADDLMWYRAEALDWLEQNGIPTVDVQGRPRVRFRVRGELHEFDYSSETHLDLIVLYDTDRPPRAVAPVDVSLEAATYFGIEPPPSP